MSATVGAALKKILTALLLDPKTLKKALTAALCIFLALFMPTAAAVSVFNTDLHLDGDEMLDAVVENLSPEDAAMLRQMEDTALELQSLMEEQEYTERQVLCAQVLYVLVLSDRADDPRFVENLVWCFEAGQTDADFIDRVNWIFRTDIDAGDFTRLLHSIQRQAETGSGDAQPGTAGGGGSTDIVAVAQSQIGNVGGEPYWRWYGFGGRVEWCACFVSWCANECGYIEDGIIPAFAGCVTGANWFIDRGEWRSRNYTPSPGDLIFFDWDDAELGQDGEADHVGIVEKVENGYVCTIEGNSGDRCKRNRYAIGYYEIYGYATPSYPKNSEPATNQQEGDRYEN